VLERGREWLPGDFPDELGELALELRGALNPLGLLENNTHPAAGMDVLCASGLGGTSLLNAAITLRPAPNVWAQPEWPAAVRADFTSGALDHDFATAEAMLRPGTSPMTRSIARAAAHLACFEERARSRGVRTGELTLNVNHEPGREQHGVRQAACTACGNCCGGCNVGAKNTLTTNYLPCAKDHGASLFTQLEVTHLEKLPLTRPSDARWLVHYVHHAMGPLGLPERRRGALTANAVFLGAGSVGTTRILMRSEREGLALSEHLGSRVSANGDVLGAIYNTDVRTGVVPFRDTRAPAGAGQAAVGQTISTYADFRSDSARLPLDEQFVLLDGVIPRPFVPAAARLLSLHPAALAGAIGSPAALGRLGRDALMGLYPSPEGALGHSMILLACGHDSASGRYVAHGESLYVAWPGILEERSFRAIRREMEAYAERMGGVFIANPRSELVGGAMQATHPLGGATMSDAIATGVVSHLGQVWDPTGDVHEGLFVTDAAAIPRSLGAPPLITITALAERAMRHALAERAMRQALAPT
nr:GMC oxidoreductase [Myxococcota bacterium]